MKALYFDRGGFALWLKKLDQSKLPWPKNVDIDVIHIELKEVELLLEEIIFWTRLKDASFEQLV